MKFRRRQYIVNAGLQMRYALIFIVIALLGNVCAVTVFNIKAFKKLDDIRWSTHLDIESLGELLTPLFISVNVVMIVFLAIVLTITGIWMIRKSSGPIYRMSKDIERFAAGDLSAHIGLREKDEFQDVAVQLNDMMKTLGGELVSIREQYHSLSLSLSNLENALKSGETSNCEGLLNDLSDLESRLEKFQT
jgi:methyl-accepting chemotaxis protein